MLEDVPELVKRYAKKLKEEKSAYAEEVDDLVRSFSKKSN